MELLGLAGMGALMVAVVFAVGVTVEVLFARRFGAPRPTRHDSRAQAHQQAVRSQLGGFGPSGGPQH